MAPKERKQQILKRLAAEPSERTMYNFGRGLTCALLEVDSDRMAVKAFINTRVDNPEYRRGALDELEFWS